MMGLKFGSNLPDIVDDTRYSFFGSGENQSAWKRPDPVRDDGVGHCMETGS